MNKQLKNIYLILTILLLTTNCSALFGGSTNSEGNQSISNSPTGLQFSAAVNTEQYRTIQFTNRSNETYEISNLALLNNDCGAFSVFNITDSNDDTLYMAGDHLSVFVSPAQTVNINILFSPIPCYLTEYTTTFIIYYKKSNLLKAESLALNVVVDDNTPPGVVCEENTTEYYDDFENPTSRLLPPLPDGQLYYLRVDRMSSYLQTTEAFIGFAMPVGTHINVDLIPEDERFKPVYIPITTDDSGNVIIHQFNECINFRLPTEVTDNFFLGASVTITSNNDYMATINRDSQPGRLDVPDVQFKLKSFIGNSDSLLQDANGFFEANINFNLTTDETEENSFLDDLIDFEDDDGNFLLPIANSKLVGNDIRHGTVTIVGIGQFVDDADLKLSNEARSALIENEAYLFLQIQGVITQELP